MVSDTPILDLRLRACSSETLCEQLYRALRTRMQDGRLSAGQRLPPSRKLAEELAVSRTTVVTAYDQLVAEGFAFSRKGAGVFVSDIGEVEAGLSRMPALSSIAQSPKLEPAKPFHPGVPDARLFPYRAWAKCVARVARTDPQALVLGNHRFGDWQLRQQICHYLREWRGVQAEPQQILITAGASEALELCIRSLVDEGDYLGLEDPGYPPIRAFVDSLGLPSVQLAMDEQGALPPDQAATLMDPKLVILTPSSLFPLGGALPQARRNAFLNWAKAANAWIIEDDYDSEFRYAGRPIPAMMGLDGHARTLYVGSFAKIFADNLRMGFVVIPQTLIETFTETLSRFRSKASVMPQRPLAEFMRQGEYYRHIRRVRRIYSERREALIHLLQTHLSGVVSFTDHRAGMLIAVKLPGYLKDIEIAQQAEKIGLSCPALSRYFAGPKKQNGLLLGFCGYTVDELENAMLLLRDLINKLKA